MLNNQYSSWVVPLSCCPSWARLASGDIVILIPVLLMMSLRLFSTSMGPTQDRRTSHNLPSILSRSGVKARILMFKRWIFYKNAGFFSFQGGGRFKDTLKNEPLKRIFLGSNGYVALQVYKSKLFLAQKCKKIFLCVKGVQKTEKKWKKFWKNFEIFFS